MARLDWAEANFIEFITLPPAVFDSLNHLQQKLSFEQQVNPDSYVSCLEFDRFIDSCERRFEQDKRALIISLALQGTQCTLTPYMIKGLSLRAGALLGELLVQNEAGERSVSVYDRDRTFSMHRGSRYHQTREGGSLHTDNVNIPEPWDYLLFSCLSPALVGGESILADGVKVHALLSANFPEALKILESDFVWEMRGVADKLYHAPVITYDGEGRPYFRYLRPYMESAQLKTGKPLSVEKLYAMDVLDALLESANVQVRTPLLKGDMLLSRDAQVFHGRTCFSDALNSVNLSEFNQGSDGQILKRTMERLWIRKKK